MAARDSRGAKQQEWPPQHRCENCGWWATKFLHRLFGLAGKMGFCSHPQVEDETWRSFVCWRHTAGAYEDLGPSLRARVFKLVDAKLKERRDAQ